MESLLSLPWNIEVMLSRDSTPTSGLQLRLDTFIDALPGEDSPGAGAAAVGTPDATKMVGGYSVKNCREPRIDFFSCFSRFFYVLPMENIWKPGTEWLLLESQGNTVIHVSMPFARGC